jgi:hypothetical protein
MGFFNFIETFFFLSLGITFVLILLLVYHFKQRLTTLETKCDTVSEIISNLVKELTSIKQMQMNQFNMMNMGMVASREINSFIPTFHNSEVNGKIKVADEDFEEEDEEDEEEEDDEDEDEGNDEDEDDEEDEDEGNEVEDNQSTIKVINVEISDTIESEIIETEIDPETVDIDESTLPELNSVELVEEEETLHVEKLEGVVETTTLVESEVIDNAKDIYNKMSIQELRQLVITKGLSSDPSKKRKPELLKLLETLKE